MNPTWARRARTIPAMLGATAGMVAAAPVALAAAVIADAVAGRRRLPTPRLYLFLLQYCINDSLEVLAAPFFRLIPGLARHLQLLSIRVLRRRAAQLLGMRLEITGMGALTRGGPAIVVSRHVSLFDAALPGLVGYDAGLEVRGIIMAELLADPGFDLLYPHLGSVFIPRDDGPEALRQITGMVDRVDDPSRTIIAIFPEGRLYRRAVAERQLARLAEKDPERAVRLVRLERSLPPRPGGLWALLQAWPQADIIVLEHEGLDEVASLEALRRAIPIDGSISIGLRRISRDDIPEDHAPFVGWLDDLWLDLDRRQTERADAAGPTIA